MGRKPNVKCCICQKDLYRRQFERKKIKRFCCRGCRSKMYQKFKNYNEDGLRQGRGWNKGMSKANGDILSYGKLRNEITKQNISKKLKGRIFSEEHKQAISKARMLLFDKIGRVGKTERGWQFARWKKLIYRRDKYTCQKCNSIDNLFAHHILICHKKLHKNKTRNNPL